MCRSLAEDLGWFAIMRTREQCAAMLGSMPPFFFPESGRLAGAECGRGPDADVSSPPSEGSIIPGRADKAVPGRLARMARTPCTDIALRRLRSLRRLGEGERIR